MDDLRSLPLDRFCNFIWFMLMRNGDENHRRKVEAMIWIPPVNNDVPIPAASPWSPERETQSLAGLKESLGLATSKITKADGSGADPDIPVVPPVVRMPKRADGTTA